MNWGQAKTLLIGIFFVLNVVLGTLYWTQRQEASISPAYYVSGGVEDPGQADDPLQRAGIQVEGRLPEAPSALPLQRVRLLPPAVDRLVAELAKDAQAEPEVIEYPGGRSYLLPGVEILVLDNGYVRMERRTMGTEQVGEERDVGSFTSFDAQMEAESFLRNYSQLPAETRFHRSERIAPGRFLVHYVQVSKGLPLFGSGGTTPSGGFLRLEVDFGEVRVLEWTLLEVEGSSGSPLPVQPAREALLRLAGELTREQAEKLVVESLEIGYYSGIYPSVEEWEIVPVWRVGTKQGDFLINAVTLVIEERPEAYKQGL